MKHPATDEVAIRRTLVHLARQGWRIVGVSDRSSYIGPRPYTPAAVARHIATTAGDPLPATPVADLQVGDLVVRTLDRHGAVGMVVSIDLDYSDPYAVVQFDDGNWSGARLAWTRVSNGTPPTSAGDGHVYVTREGTRVALYSTLYFALGNCPCEVLADHSDHKGLTADLADLDMGECFQACTMCDDSGVADDGSYCEECYS